MLNTSQACINYPYNPYIPYNPSILIEYRESSLDASFTYKIKKVSNGYVLNHFGAEYVAVDLEAIGIIIRNIEGK